jgi:hypothetical protein
MQAAQDSGREGLKGYHIPPFTGTGYTSADFPGFIE